MSTVAIFLATKAHGKHENPALAACVPSRWRVGYRLLPCGRRVSVANNRVKP